MKTETKEVKVRRHYYVPEEVDKRLGHAAVDLAIDKSALVAKAITVYLDGLKNPA